MHVLAVEKRENRKIFELQKTKCALPAAMRVGGLRDKSVFTNTFIPQTPFEKQVTYYQKYFLSGRVKMDNESNFFMIVILKGLQ